MRIRQAPQVNRNEKKVKMGRLTLKIFLTASYQYLGISLSKDAQEILVMTQTVTDTKKTRSSLAGLLHQQRPVHLLQSDVDVSTVLKQCFGSGSETGPRELRLPWFQRIQQPQLWLS